LRSQRLINQHRDKRKRKKQIAIVTFTFLLFLSLTYFLMPLFSEYKGFKAEIDKGIKSSLEYIISGKSTSNIEITQSKIKEVEVLISNKNDYSVSVIAINAKTGTKHQAGTVDPFNGASTTKIISAICYLRKVEAGKASLADPMGSYDAEFQFKQMLNQSNNISLDLINAELGINNLTSCAKNIGAPSFKYYENTVLPSEMASIMLKLSKYELLGKENTEKMLLYLQNTNEERLIPASIPDGYTAYHKYGILGGKLHDVSIIRGDGKEYILAIYTDGPVFGDERLAERINFFKDIMGILFREE
jgi:beta-lactamase class A